MEIFHFGAQFKNIRKVNSSSDDGGSRRRTSSGGKSGGGGGKGRKLGRGGREHGLSYSESGGEVGRWVEATLNPPEELLEAVKEVILAKKFVDRDIETIHLKVSHLLQLASGFGGWP